jgi:DNA-binding NtrC family response regulator
VLIQGETGTGKEEAARALHECGPRAPGPFAVLDCTAVPATLASSVLFGHEKGAFTGATERRLGVFEAAHGGTLFIDEVGELPLDLQPLLLRVLQQREVVPVGSTRAKKINVRIISATWRDLRAMVNRGTFREDLYYRLNVIPVTLPALRQRREDIPLLAQHFIKKSCKENGLPAKTVGQEAMRLLMAYEWPGNVRQFENAIEFAATMSGTETEIRAEALPADIRQGTTLAVVPPVAIPDEGIHFTSVVSQLERDLILRCLEKTGGNKRQAARLLNLSRTTFIDKLQRLNVEAGAA